MPPIKDPKVLKVLKAMATILWLEERESNVTPEDREITLQALAELYEHVIAVSANHHLKISQVLSLATHFLFFELERAQRFLESRKYFTEERLAQCQEDIKSRLNKLQSTTDEGLAVQALISKGGKYDA